MLVVWPYLDHSRENDEDPDGLLSLFHHCLSVYIVDELSAALQHSQMIIFVCLLSRQMMDMDSSNIQLFNG